jgi:hypothetical protein
MYNYTVRVEIGVRSEHSMFDPHFRRTSTIMASCGLDPALAFFPCSRALHVKGIILPENLDTTADIGISSAMSRERNVLLPEDSRTCQQLAEIHTRRPDSTRPACCSAQQQKACDNLSYPCTTKTAFSLAFSVISPTGKC